MKELFINWITTTIHMIMICIMIGIIGVVATYVLNMKSDAVQWIMVGASPFAFFATMVIDTSIRNKRSAMGKTCFV